MQELTESLRSDPKLKSQATRAAAERIRLFACRAEAHQDDLADTKLAIAETALRNAAAAEAAANAAAGPRFDASYLAGTGSDAWRTLWEAARAFSVADAYPGEAFPAAHEGCRCVLCQQTLGDDAISRLRAFDAYVQERTRAEAEKARATVAELAARTSRLLPLAPEHEKVLADLAVEPVEAREAIASFVTSADARLLQLQWCLRAGAWEIAPSLPACPVADLNRIAEALVRRAEMELSADDPAKKALLRAELAELEDREWLSRCKDAVFAELAQHHLITRLEMCLADTTTNAITIQSGELHDVYVTQAFCDRFASERSALGLATLDVILEPTRGTKGERCYGIRLVGSSSVSVHDIASEGEQRCIALAAFLAELSQASHRSALVFDDPVCSLDHSRRASVARRLCAEAQNRQVIVFTHDPVFLGELLDAARDRSIVPECRHLTWQGMAPGFCEAGLPWEWQTYKERLGALEKEARELAPTWNPVPNPDNIGAMRRAYSHYRATLERILQDVIFAGIIVRYRSWIKVDHDLEQVVGFSEPECRQTLRLHKRACGVTDAHDPAGAKHAAVPTPAELSADIADLRALVELVQNRRKAIKLAVATAAVANKGTAVPTTQN